MSTKIPPLSQAMLVALLNKKSYSSSCRRRIAFYRLRTVGSRLNLARQKTRMKPWQRSTIQSTNRSRLWRIGWHSRLRSLRRCVVSWTISAEIRIKLKRATSKTYWPGSESLAQDTRFCLKPQERQSGIKINKSSRFRSSSILNGRKFSRLFMRMCSRRKSDSSKK